MSRFDFLKDKFQPLYDRCTQAEQSTDISVKMLKIRQTLEYLVRELGEDGNDLFNNIGSLSDRDILDENISKLFQRTRMITNRGIHENQEDSVTPDEGRTAMDNLAEIAVCMRSNIGKSPSH